MHLLRDASSSHVLALTFGVFPGTFCISSFHYLVALALALRVLFQLSLSLLRLTPRGVLTIARLPGVSGPSGDRSDAATSANSTYVSLTHARFSFLATLRPRAFSAPRRFIPHRSLRPYLMSVSPLGFLGLRRFLPVRSPGSLSARGVLRVVVASFLPCGRRARSASRMSASGGCVDATLRV